jgi:Holliday junction resolvase
VTGYDRGAAYERRVKADLEGHGYTVIRSAGSKSPVDLIACKPGEVLFVQCKTGIVPANQSSVSGEEWNHLLEAAVFAGADPVIADRDPVHPLRIRYRLIVAPHWPGSHEWPAARWGPDDLEAHLARRR